MDVSTVEIAVAERPTKSVTLTPFRATVVREIRTTIQPGPNEITLFGLDPKILPDSIRIEGTGPATITDIQTSIVRRRGDLPDDVYSAGESDPDSDSDSDEENEDLNRLRGEIHDVETRLAQARTNMIRTQTQLEFLDTYGRKLSPETTTAEEVGAFLTLYASQRGTDAKVYHAAGVEEREMEGLLGKLTAKLEKMEKRVVREKERMKREERRERMVRMRVRAREKEGRRRRREETKAFATEMMGEVVVFVDSGSSMEQHEEIRLLLSYVLPQATWTPRYELSISTPTTTATMVYRAEYYNRSSETWRDAQVTLSTSEATWSRLDEAVPSLSPWHIRLDTTQRAQTQMSSWNRILSDSSEQPSGGLFAKPATKPLFGAQPQAQPQAAAAFGAFGNAASQSTQTGGSSLFGQSSTSTTGGGLFGGSQQQQPTQSSGGLFGGQQQQQQQQQSTGASLFGGPPASSGFGSAASAPAQSTSGGLFGRSQPTPPEASNNDPPLDNVDIGLTVEAMDPRDSIQHDYGLTTTYALPGTRSIAPSHHGRRHVLAELVLPTIALSYMIVPKKRAAAFFRARITNTSSVKILPGRLGLTVDGIFLGTTTMTKPCAPEGAFQVSLGIDPAIQVSYATPMVRRVTGGFFAKEDAALFRRSCWVKNTKAIPVTVVVCDQVPVSREEALQVKIVEPKGLEGGENGDGDGDRAGRSVRWEMDEAGSGEVTVLSDGEVRWTGCLLPGKEVRVVLEYETRAPLGSEVV